MIYRTKDGDVLDQLCARHYGDTPYRVEDVIAANPGLAGDVVWLAHHAPSGRGGR